MRTKTLGFGGEGLRDIEQQNAVGPTEGSEKGRRVREKEKWRGEGRARGAWEGRKSFDMVAGWKSSVVGQMWLNVK